ncbi:MAG: tryptophan synthase subunit alpha [Thermomicrobiales bacterium]
MSVTETPTSTIAQSFASCAAENRAALMPFLTAGYPTLQRSAELLDAIVAAGADLVEIGIPFSDPLADGATVQHTSQVALEQGVTVQDAFDLVRGFRQRGGTVPIVFMGYTNPFLQYGLERLGAEAASAGVDGFIIPDLPLEESDEFSAPLRRHGRDLIFLVAPTSTDRRLRDVAGKASGFLYCVSLVGVTGARDRLWEGLSAYIERVRSFTDLPLAIGFGISTPSHVREAASIADGVIVASALLNHVDAAPENEQADAARAFVEDFKKATYRNGSNAESA